MNIAAFALAGALALAGCEAYAAPANTADTRLGPVLVDGDGMTLYTFTKDSAGKSVCYGGCAAQWPPFTAAAGAQDDGRFTVIARDDGSRQWALDGQPLYLWANDRKPGDTTGEGVGNVWFVARP